MVGGINGLSNSYATSMQQRMESMLNRADGDGDGMLDKSEFQTFISGMSEVAGAAPDADAMFSETDGDGDGLVSLAELQSARPTPPPMTQIGGMDTSEMDARLEEDFNAADEDGDGMLSESEFQTFIGNMPQGPGGAPDAAEMFAAADTDSDGMVSLEDVKAARPSGPPPPPPPAGGAQGVSGEEDEEESSLLELISSIEDETDTLFDYLDNDSDGKVGITDIISSFSRNATEIYSIMSQYGAGSEENLDLFA